MHGGDDLDPGLHETILENTPAGDAWGMERRNASRLMAMGLTTTLDSVLHTHPEPGVKNPNLELY